MTGCGWCGSLVMSTLSLSDLIRFSYRTDPFCQQCRKKLMPLDPCITCRGCCKLYTGHDYCPDCMMWRHRYPDYKGNHHALYKYNTFAKEIIQQFKFMGDCDIANLFSQEIKSCFQKRKASDLIVPIPLSSDSYAVRGFNQTELLLEAADLPMSLLLENRYQTEKQSKKNREERLNSLQPFVIKEEYKRDIKGNNIILADDIYTTGRTMYHAIELINKYDPASVTTFSVFR